MPSDGAEKDDTERGPSALTKQGKKWGGISDGVFKRCDRGQPGVDPTVAPSQMSDYGSTDRVALLALNK